MAKKKEPREFVVAVSFTVVRDAFVPVRAATLKDAREKVMEMVRARTLDAFLDAGELWGKQWPNGITVSELHPLAGDKILAGKPTRLECPPVEAKKRSSV
jgi:hypothetical protein